MINNTDKTPYYSEKWVGEEDISKSGESFIFDTISLISRGESLVECGIFKQDQSPLFMSAVIELLIITRSLLQRKKDLNAISSIELGRVEHWRQINGKKNSERLIFKFSHKKDIVRYASHYAQR